MQFYGEIPMAFLKQWVSTNPGRLNLRELHGLFISPEKLLGPKKNLAFAGTKLG
jgi:hypothetical protein